MQNNKPQTLAEEASNAGTHLISSIFFLFLSTQNVSPRPATYCLIFACMFFSSFLYHAQTRLKHVFRNIDMFFIYVVIGATGLIVPNNIDIRAIVFMTSVLSLSALHHGIRGFLEIPEGYSVPVLYLLNGLIAAYCVMIDADYLTWELLMSLVTYIAGFFLYINDHIKFFHTGWHVACSTGSYFMYLHLISNLS